MKATREVVRKYYKYDTSNPRYNINAIGNLINSEGVISGFSTSNYATVPNTFNFLDASTYKVKVKFTTGSNISTVQCIFNSLYTIFLFIQNGSFKFGLGNGSSWSILDYSTVISSVSANTEYLFELEFTGTQYLIKLNNELLYTVTSTNKIGSGSSKFTLGIASDITSPFFGTIDLNSCNISVDDKVAWQGVTYPVIESTSSDYDFYGDVLANKVPKNVVRKYYKVLASKYVQPVNPSGITATSGWTNPRNAFDGSNSTYASCNSLTPYIEWDIGENICLAGVNTVGLWVSSKAVATNFKIYSVDENGEETELGTTKGAANTATYYTYARFEPVIVNKLRFRITQTYSGAPSRTAQINLVTVSKTVESTEEDYDFYKDVNDCYGVHLDEVQPWIQPALVENGTAGGDSFAVFADSERTSHYAYYAMDGDTTYTKSWFSNEVASDVFYGFYNPEPIKVSKFTFMNYNANDPNYTYCTRLGRVQISDDGVTWTDIKSYTNTVVGNSGATWSIDLSDNTNYSKYYRIYSDTNASAYGWIITEFTIEAVQKKNN